MSRLTYRWLIRTASGISTSPDQSVRPDHLKARLAMAAPGRFTRIGNCVGSFESDHECLVFGYQGTDPDDGAAFDRLMDILSPVLGLPVAG